MSRTGVDDTPVKALVTPVLKVTLPIFFFAGIKIKESLELTA